MWALTSVLDTVSISGRGAQPLITTPWRMACHRPFSSCSRTVGQTRNAQHNCPAAQLSHGTSSSLANGEEVSTSSVNGNGNGKSNGNGASGSKWKALKQGAAPVNGELLDNGAVIDLHDGILLDDQRGSSVDVHSNEPEQDPQHVVEYLKTLGLSGDTVEWAKKHVPALFDLELSSLVDELPKELSPQEEADLLPEPPKVETPSAPPPQPAQPESLKRLRPRFSVPTPSRMNHLSRRKHRQFAPSPRAGEVCNYLRTLGLHDDHLRWIQILVPELFELQVDQELKANWVRLFDNGIAPRSVIRQLRSVVVLEFLTSLGVSVADCVIIAQSHPAAFCSSLEEIIEPLVVTLSKIGIPKIEIGQVLARYPELFSLKLEEDIWPVVDCLQEHLHDKAAVAQLVHSYPGIFTHPKEVIISNILRKVQLLSSIGINQSYVYSLLGRVPRFFACPVDDMEAATMLLQELGFTESQVQEFLPGFQQLAKA